MPNISPRVCSRSTFPLLTVASLVLAGTFGCAAGGYEPVASNAVQIAPTASLTGTAHGGQQPISGATLQLYKAGAPAMPSGSSTGGYGTNAAPLITVGSMTVGSTNNFYPGGAGGCSYVSGNTNACTVLPQTTSNGNFTLTGDYTCTAGDQVYLVATGGNPGLPGTVNNPYITLMAALGTCPAGGNFAFISVNEVTTAAAVWALQRFLAPASGTAGGSYTSQGGTVNGIGVNVGAPSGPAGGYANSGVQTAVLGLKNAFAMTRNLVGLSSGVSESPDNTFATPWSAKINTIADILSACVNSDPSASGICSSLMSDATPSGYPGPGDTLQAALYMALNPGNNVANLFSRYVNARPPFVPLTSAPTDWGVTVGLAPQTGGSPVLTSMSNAAVDKYGHIWVVNTDINHGSPSVVELAADGSYLAGPFGNAASPYSVVAAYKGNGYSGCVGTGHVLATATTGPRGITIDGSGEVWVTNTDEATCGTGTSVRTIMRMTGSNTASTGGALDSGYTIYGQPYGLITDTAGNVDETSQSNKVYQFTGGGTTVVNGAAMPNSTSLPQALAVDTKGPNLWVMASMGCGGTASTPIGELFQSRVGAPGTFTGTFSGGGCTAGAYFSAADATPTSIVMDQNNNLWMANSSANSLTYAVIDANGYIDGFSGIGTNVPGSPIGGNYVASTPDSGTAPGLGGLQAPYALALDGINSVWSVNSSQAASPSSVGHFGATYDPAGGSPVIISNLVTGSANGFTFPAATSPYPVGSKAVVVDPSGNVWIMNSNQTTAPGYLSVLVGAASPVITPAATQLKVKPTLTSISVAPVTNTAAIVVGGTEALVVTGTYSDNSTANLTTSSTFSSSSTAVATVNSSGVVTGVASGNATLTATDAGLSASVQVVVTPRQTAANAVITSLGPVTKLALTIPSGPPATEAPPQLVTLPGVSGSSLYLPTGQDYLCTISANPLQASASSPVVISSSQCGVVDLPPIESAPLVYIAPTSGNSNTGSVPSATKQWALDYDAVYGANVTQNTLVSPATYQILTVNHGETKDYRVQYDQVNHPGSYYYYLSPFVEPRASAPNPCGIGQYAPLDNGYTGYVTNTNTGKNEFDACFPTYGAFTSLSINSLSSSNPLGQSIANISEVGPVVWPSTGYYSADLKTQYSNGLRQPSSIVANGYLYIYVLDTSGVTAYTKFIVGQLSPGAQPTALSANGTKVARALIGLDGLPGPFMSYNVFTNAFDQPSLPQVGADGTPGFDKNNLSNYFSQPGPQVPALFSTDPGGGGAGYSLQTSHFGVGYDAANHIYVGSEEYIDYSSGSGVSTLALRLSYDLVHWSSRSPVTYGGTTIPGSGFMYPTFASADFTSNTNVNLANLYVMGTGGGKVYYFQVSVQPPSQ